MIKQERLLKIILSPHLSEKAAIAKDNANQYVFKVAKNATKPEIKEAVEMLFSTSVDAVRIVNVKSKPKRFGSIQGKSKSWKKAYVKLTPGQKIEYATA
jgi:large subunit ribosomal protein L23